MAMQINNNKMTEVITLISEKGFAGMGDALQILFNEAMLVERSSYLQSQSL